jgi:phosphatidylserine/phosphatidylglycerophosphate/cardiolipin synthase-like enzyme
MVVIDQKIGFIGGLDLGYGRMDSKQHFLTDQSG